MTLDITRILHRHYETIGGYHACKKLDHEGYRYRYSEFAGNAEEPNWGIITPKGRDIDVNLLRAFNRGEDIRLPKEDKEIYEKALLFACLLGKEIPINSNKHSHRQTLWESINKPVS